MSSARFLGLANSNPRFDQFDGIFLADIVGVYDVYRGGPAPSIVDAVQIPVNDPMMVVPVMAAVTEQIGFGVTAKLTYEPPYLFARRMSTLDHLTGGRVGWNIVTGDLDSAARGMGLMSHASLSSPWREAKIGHDPGSNGGRRRPTRQIAPGRVGDLD